MKMKILLLALVLLLGGCSPASKSPTPSKQTTANQSDMPIQIGTQPVYFIDEKSAVKFLKTTFDSASDKAKRHLQKMLQETSIVSQEDGEFTFNSFGSLTLNRPAKIHSAALNKERNEYLVSGTWSYDYTIRQFSGQVTNKTTSIHFIVVYDGENETFKGFYYNFSDSKYHRIYLDQNGNNAFIRMGNPILIDLSHKKTLRINPPSNLFTSSFLDFSNDGTMLAFTFKDYNSKDTTIVIYDTKTAQEKRKFYHHGDIYPSGKFSTDSTKFFSSEKSLSKIHILDLHKNSSSFIPKEKDSSVIFDAFDTYMHIYILNSHHIIMNIQDNTTLCQSPRGTLHFINASIDTQKQILTTIDEYKIKKYLIEDKQCQFVKESSLSESLYIDGVLNEDFIIEENSIIAIGENGAIKTAKVPQLSVSDLEIQIAKKTTRINTLIDAGFEARGLKLLEQLVKDSSFDVFKDHYFLIHTSLSVSHRVYFQLLAYERYKDLAEDIALNKDFERSLRNYIFYASVTGFKELIPSAIDAYEKQIGTNPTPKQQEMLALFKATYLLEIGKDEQAYNLLFDLAPLSKESKKIITDFSHWKIGLMKDPKKLSIATGIDQSALLNPSYAPKVDFIFDMQKNKVVKGQQPQPKALDQSKTPSPKEEAIRLLD